MNIRQFLQPKPMTPVGDVKSFNAINAALGRATIRLMALIFFTSMTLVYLLPEILWEHLPFLGSAVTWLGGYFQSIHRFNTLSLHPQIFATVYAFWIVASPVLAIIFFIRPQARYVQRMADYKVFSLTRILLSIIGFVLMAWAILNIVPAESGGTSRYSRLLWEMGINKFAFSFGTALSITVLSVMIAGTFNWLHHYTLQAIEKLQKP